MDFTQKEWEDCIKVLKIIAREPDKSLDTDTLKGLVTKIYKRAKKENKAKALQQKMEILVPEPALISIDKAQKWSQNQDIYKQYDKSLQTDTIRVQNYESTDILPTVTDNDSQREFIYPRKCYQCKIPYKKLHFFYHTLCPDCASLNYDKRQQSCNLTGRVALVTGGRIKIGYLTALKMLRDGAKVWVTTRFPNDCAKRFSTEPDFDNWSNRLKIVGLDFRNLQTLSAFITHLNQNEPYLDIIINNAAQTIKRPPAFYAHLLDFEQQEYQHLPAHFQKILPLPVDFRFLAGLKELKLASPQTDILFPKGELDKDGQQIDKRDTNSWTLLLEQVPPIEMLETQLVNVTAPFMLNSSLKSLLMKSPFERKFIVNVSAMEGQFNRSSKTPFHPHTNMAKAALNMMTRTSAQEYATHSIFMNSVDTGWITQENPYPTKERLYKEEGFVPPLDEIDGMARIYDPIARGINNPELPLFGHFLKDYQPYFW